MWTAQARQQRAREKRRDVAKRQADADWRAREGFGPLAELPTPNVRASIPAEWRSETEGAETRARPSRSAHNTLGVELGVPL